MFLIEEIIWVFVYTLSNYLLLWRKQTLSLDLEISNHFKNIGKSGTKEQLHKARRVWMLKDCLILLCATLDKEKVILQILVISQELSYNCQKSTISQNLTDTEWLLYELPLSKISKIFPLINNINTSVMIIKYLVTDRH